MNTKQKQQLDKIQKLQNTVKSKSVLKKIRAKMQLNSIRLEDLKCLKHLFEAKENGAYPLFLNQITKVLKHYKGKITSQEIHDEVRPYYCDNPKLQEYLLQIWSEMIERNCEILIFDL